MPLGIGKRKQGRRHRRLSQLVGGWRLNSCLERPTAQAQIEFAYVRTDAIFLWIVIDAHKPSARALG